MGMNCPLCGAKARCYETRRTKVESVKRHYECLSCRNRFSTSETLVKRVLPFHPLRHEPFTGVTNHEQKKAKDRETQTINL